MIADPKDVQLLARRGRLLALAFCVANWLVPGTGYLLAGDARRGWAQFAILNGILLVGFAMGGFFLPPVFDTRNPNFSLVSLLTFLVQFFHGGGWLLASLAELATQRGGDPGLLAFFAGRPGAVFSDLGAFHLVVAGGLNYYATMRLYDFLAGNPDPNHLHNPALVEAAKGLGEAGK